MWHLQLTLVTISRQPLGLATQYSDHILKFLVMSFFSGGMNHHIIKNVVDSMALLQGLAKYLLVHFRCTSYTEHQSFVSVQSLVCTKYSNICGVRR